MPGNDASSPSNQLSACQGKTRTPSATYGGPPPPTWEALVVAYRSGKDRCPEGGGDEHGPPSPRHIAGVVHLASTYGACHGVPAVQAGGVSFVMGCPPSRRVGCPLSWGARRPGVWGVLCHGVPAVQAGGVSFVMGCPPSRRAGCPMTD